MLFAGKCFLKTQFCAKFIHFSCSKTIISTTKAILHLWMIIFRVSLTRSDETRAFKITIKCSSGISYHLTNLHSSEIPAKGLFKAVERMTEIPSNKQMLFYKAKAIDPNSWLKLDNGSCIDLLVKGSGGSGETDAGTCLKL